MTDDSTESIAELSDDDILSVARDRFRQAEEASHNIRELAREDLKFSVGDQWPEEIKNARAEDGRPCLVINRIPQQIRQVTNDQRQNRPAIKVSPVDDKADIETAKIFQGIIRHIENASDADTAYDTAFDSAVRASFGFFRIVTEFCDPMSFDQEIRIKRIRNRFCAYLDPASQEPDGSDANWGFVFDDISREEFKALYPESEVSTSDSWEALGNEIKDWVGDKTVRVAEYFFKEFQKTQIVLLSDGSVVEKSALPKLLPEGIEVVAERETTVPKIRWLKINGAEILEKTDWPGKWIPIIPVYGEEVDTGDELTLSGIVRYAKDPQRMYNYWKSVETETIALAPRAPIIGVEGQFEGHEAKWQTANRRNHAYLEYKPKTIGGQPAPAPQRNVFEPPVQAITNAGMYAAEDIKATTGVYDAALGAKSNETSGVAIQRRSAQAQTSNFHFIDNLSKSIRHCGRQLVDLIPRVYDTARAVRILGEDGTEEIIRINELFEHKGKPVIYQLDKGKYDVSVSTGPTFETKRQEAVASMVDMSKASPQLMQVAGDIMVQNMDWPGAQEIAERIRKTLPPGIAENDDKKKQPIPPEVQQQMAQMNQMIEALTAQLNEANGTIETKRIELESRERIEFAKIQRDIEIKLAELGSTEALALLRAEIDEIQGRLNLLNINEPIETEPGGADPNGDVMPGYEQQQPTGGPSPGYPMGESP